MNLTALFIKRPVMTALVMMAIIIFGVAGYRTLPVSDLPNIDYPTIQVQANLPGASPETMAASVATVLERQFSTVPGVDSMTSTSVRGRSNVTLQFSLEGLPSAPGPGAAPPVAENPNPSLFTAVQEQLGLRLESVKGPVEVLVIESVQKPTEN